MQLRNKLQDLKFYGQNLSDAPTVFKRQISTIYLPLAGALVHFRIGDCFGSDMQIMRGCTYMLSFQLFLIHVFQTKDISGTTPSCWKGHYITSVLSIPEQVLWLSEDLSKQHYLPTCLHTSLGLNFPTFHLTNLS